jgi:putative Mn2+ efflux pump MntP
MLALILVAVSVGLSNLAASVGIGVDGVTMSTRLRVVLTFGLLEAGMPIIGLLIGHSLAASVGHQAKWIAAGLLAAVGCYSVVTALRKRGEPRQASPARAESAPAERSAGQARQEWLKLGLSGFALSLDNLVAGFALGSYQVNLVAGALAFGLVSVVLSLIGLEIGARLGVRLGGSGEVIGGVILIGVGAAVGFGVLG